MLLYPVRQQIADRGDDNSVFLSRSDYKFVVGNDKQKVILPNLLPSILVDSVGLRNLDLAKIYNKTVELEFLTVNSGLTGSGWETLLCTYKSKADALPVSLDCLAVAEGSVNQYESKRLGRISDEESVKIAELPKLFQIAIDVYQEWWEVWHPEHENKPQEAEILSYLKVKHKIEANDAKAIERISRSDGVRPGGRPKGGLKPCLPKSRR